MGDLNNRHSFLTVLEAGNSKIKALKDLVSGRSSFLLCPLMEEGARELLGVSFIKALILSMRAPPS